jgi:hypothetical protein
VNTGWGRENNLQSLAKELGVAAGDITHTLRRYDNASVQDLLETMKQSITQRTHKILGRTNVPVTFSGDSTLEGRKGQLSSSSSMLSSSSSMLSSSSSPHDVKRRSSDDKEDVPLLTQRSVSSSRAQRGVSDSSSSSAVTSTTGRATGRNRLLFGLAILASVATLGLAYLLYRAFR